MEIVKIEPLSKTKLRLTAQDGRTLLVTRRDAALCGLPAVATFSVSEQTWEALREAQRTAVLHRCGDLLSGRDYTSAKLRGKLAADGYPQEAVDYAVAAMEEAHYLDDKRYAQTYIRYHLRDKSRLRMKQDLTARGVPAEVIAAALEEAADEEDLDGCEAAQIQALLEKKRFDSENATWQECQKMMAFLCRRGFSQDTVRRVMRGGEK